MKKEYIIILTIVLYLLSINVIASFFPQGNLVFTSDTGEGEGQKLDLNEQVSVLVEKPRIYGKIIQQNGYEDLYVLNVLPLPLKRGNISFILPHILILVAIPITYIQLNKKEEKHE